MATEDNGIAQKAEAPMKIEEECSESLIVEDDIPVTVEQISRIRNFAQLQKAKVRLQTINIDASKHSTKLVAVNVMKLLRSGLCDVYIMLAKGRDNVRQAEEVCEMATMWINIISMEHIPDTLGSHVRIKFARSILFKEEFFRMKKKV